MTDPVSEHKELAELKDLAPNTPVGAAHGIAAIALSMAMKYHDIGMIKDGVLYQQYKLEGRNLQPLHLDMVFETAIKIEMHLLGASQRIAQVVIEAIAYGDEALKDEVEKAEADGVPTTKDE